MNKSLFPLLFALTPIVPAGCNSGEEIVSARISEPFARIVEYTPAPGQFINEPKSGFEQVTTPAAACAYAEKRLAAGKYVSLGGWGGMIVAAFAAPVLATGDYDLYVKGNTMGENTSEPGVVWVAEDTDGDGSPEGETWYELRGSRYDDPATVRGYRIEYTRAADYEPVAWTDNRGGSGSIGRMDAFRHEQPSYYPAWIGSETLAFEGTLLPANIDEGTLEGGQAWLLTSFEWGYADNVSAIDALGKINRFRIADAVTADGAPAALAQIDFIRVQTGVNAWRPAIGEISTEVCGIGCYRNIRKTE